MFVFFSQLWNIFAGEISRVAWAALLVCVFDDNSETQQQPASSSRNAKREREREKSRAVAKRKEIKHESNVIEKEETNQNCVVDSCFFARWMTYLTSGFLAERFPKTQSILSLSLSSLSAGRLFFSIPILFRFQKATTTTQSLVMRSVDSSLSAFPLYQALYGRLCF